MTMNNVSHEYAEALFMLAAEDSSFGEYQEALDLINNVFHDNPNYIDFLTSYTIPMSERIEALDKAFSNAIPKNVMSFVKILCRRQHIDIFCDCVSEFKALLDTMNKVSKARVTSAVDLKADEKDALRAKLEKVKGHTVIIDYTVDKAILGGLIVEIDGKVMDSSLRKHLKDVKDVIK